MISRFGGFNGLMMAATEEHSLAQIKKGVKMAVRHKCFISYNSADKKAVDDFCEEFEGTFIRRGIEMEEDIINAENTTIISSRLHRNNCFDRQVYLGKKLCRLGSVYEKSGEGEKTMIGPANA